MKTCTMITRHGIGKDTTAYTLISSDYQTVTMPVRDLINAINSKQLAVTNLAVDGAKGIVSTNGALDKYTLINSQTNQVEGTARAVILDRVEKNDKLIGYTVFTQAGTIAELNINDAAALANKGLISNGKVRHTAEGDIVSAIGGTYPLRSIKIEEAPKGEITVDVLYFGKVVGVPTEYFGAIIACTSATEMSKLADVLNKSNAKVISDVAKVAGQSVRDSLAITRMGTNSLYGVFEKTVLDKLITRAALNNKLGKITVSAIKYTDGDADEATVTLDTNWKMVGSKYEGSRAEQTVKEYTKKIVNDYSKVKVNK